MVIDFRELEAKRTEHMRDGRGHVLSKRTDPDFGGIILNTIPPGSSIGMHQHTENYEICYILSGRAYEKTPDSCTLLEPGMVTYCPLGEKHELSNEFDEDFVFFGVLPNK